jgi:hypothetical protein
MYSKHARFLCFLLATIHTLHGGACLVVHSVKPPHTVMHPIYEYHVDNPWISMPLHGFHSMMLDAEKEAYNVHFIIM